MSFNISSVIKSESPMKRKLLFVVNVDWFFMSHRLPIALEAIRQGYAVHIACALTDKQTVLQSLGLVVHPLSLNRSGTGITAIWETFLQIFRVCKLVKPNVVHFVTIKPVLLGGWRPVQHAYPPWCQLFLAWVSFLWPRVLRRLLDAGW